MLDQRALALPGGALAESRLDGDLARAAQGGDLGAFESLVLAYQRRVFGLAYQHLHDVDEAQDLAQEVFVRLYRNLHKYDPERPFQPWFWRLAGNVALSYRRRRPAPHFEIPSHATVSPEADRLPLELAIASLDEGLRLPLLLHYQADLSIEDVGAALDLTVAAVKSRLHRARSLLRKLLAEDAA